MEVFVCVCVCVCVAGGGGGYSRTFCPGSLSQLALISMYRDLEKKTFAII